MNAHSFGVMTAPQSTLSGCIVQDCQTHTHAQALLAGKAVAALGTRMQCSDIAVSSGVARCMASSSGRDNHSLPLPSSVLRARSDLAATHHLLLTGAFRGWMETSWQLALLPPAVLSPGLKSSENIFSFAHKVFKGQKHTNFAEQRSKNIKHKKRDFRRSQAAPSARKPCRSVCIASPPVYDMS